MNAADIIVVTAAVVTLAGLGWFFFGPRKAKAAVLAGGMQQLALTVKGGYRPEVIPGTPGRASRADLRPAGIR